MSEDFLETKRSIERLSQIECNVGVIIAAVRRLEEQVKFIKKQLSNQENKNNDK